MFWRAKRKKSGGLTADEDASLQSLESRQMLSGVVQVQAYPLIGAGFLNLVGDNSVHSIKMTSTAGGGLDAYTITSKDGTAVPTEWRGATLDVAPGERHHERHFDQPWNRRTEYV